MVFNFENHFQLVRIFLYFTYHFFNDLDWQKLDVRKIQHWGLNLGFSWISCIKCVWSRTSWFSQFKGNSSLYVFSFDPPNVFFMSRNGKNRGSVKYNIGDLISGFSWISWLNCFWSRTSWFSRLKSISNLYIFLFDPLDVLFISRKGKFRGSVKYSIGDLIFRFSWISCINCFWSRTSWFSQLKTLSNLDVFFLSLFIFFPWLEKEIIGGRKIQHWGLNFWIFMH